MIKKEGPEGPKEGERFSPLRNSEVTSVTRNSKIEGKNCPKKKLGRQVGQIIQGHVDHYKIYIFLKFNRKLFKENKEASGMIRFALKKKGLL